eukprot:TRINITY_DN5103_c1_g1_i1.p1 TRINITY_DN5103_c1_g1~~TRINITY_DN5103_c1_g1_i1.p1  ORF type:complete len:340 (-),score=61.71 TRINITY_DN5103_c1_g1_i1:172-1191(-)
MLSIRTEGDCTQNGLAFTSTKRSRIFLIGSPAPERWVGEVQVEALSSTTRIQVGCYGETSDEMVPIPRGVSRGDVLSIKCDTRRRRLVVLQNVDEIVNRGIALRGNILPSIFIEGKATLKCNFGQEPFLFTPSDDEFQPLMQKEASPAIQMMFDKYSSEKKLIESEGLLRITDDLKFTDGYSPYILLQKMSPGNFHVDFVSFSAFCRKYNIEKISDISRLLEAWKKDVLKSSKELQSLLELIFTFTNYTFSGRDHLKSPLSVENVILLFDSLQLEWPLYPKLREFLVAKQSAEGSDAVVSFAAFTFLPLAVSTYRTPDDYDTTSPPLYDEFAEWHREHL